MVHRTYRMDMHRPNMTRVKRNGNDTLHTNLVVPASGTEHSKQVTYIAGGSNLEYGDLGRRRWGNGILMERLLCRIKKVEAAMVVNNNAAAVMLILSLPWQKAGSHFHPGENCRGRSTHYRILMKEQS